MDPTEAEQHLRVIRNLMERATIYRTISAPTALVGGLLSLTASAAMIWWFPHQVVMNPNFIIVLWLAVLVITAVVNSHFIRRGAEARGEPFVSPGMKLALTSVLPSMLGGGFFTLLFLRGELSIHFLAPLWMIFYGLALLSTSHFAPRSIALLGWAFLGAGFATQPTVFDTFDPERGAVVMGLTFGLFHLLYAACAWPWRSRSRATPAEPGQVVSP